VDAGPASRQEMGKTSSSFGSLKVVAPVAINAYLSQALVTGFALQ
jgi:hypothetical protein